MSSTGFAGQVLAIGVLGFDPAGAVLALAAITAGAQRRGLSILCLSYLATMTALGLLGTAAVRLLAHTWWAHSAAVFASSHHLLAYGEILLGLALAVGAAWLHLRGLHLRGLRSRDAQDNQGAQQGANDAPASRARRRSGSLSSPSALLAGGALVALSLLADPAFSVLAVAAREQTPWIWAPSWIVWAAMSQCLLMALWVAALADRNGRILDRAGTTVRVALARSGPLLRIVLLGCGIALIALGVGELLS